MVTKTRIHALAGGIGFFTITAFWTSIVFSKFFTTDETVAAVKQMILYGMFVLISAMAIAGGSGMSMGNARTDPTLQIYVATIGMVLV